MIGPNETDMQAIRAHPDMVGAARAWAGVSEALWETAQHALGEVRLLREGTIIWTGRLGSLRRFKDDVREVNQGYECGMNLDGFNDIKVGDVIEAFSQEEVERD